MTNESIFTATVTEWQAYAMLLGGVAAGSASTAWGTAIATAIVLVVGYGIERIATARRKVLK
ncbi:hypothetical protein [Pseudomonas urethralis]|uniref:hypothetical protein n=1 Tax=Pseudomonas urethralis TaxID=2740517 RepID=UPI0015967CBF|nr:hypothetical protein [Pseudomonas urethralis]